MQSRDQCRWRKSFGEGRCKEIPRKEIPLLVSDYENNPFLNPAPWQQSRRKPRRDEIILTQCFTLLGSGLCPVPPVNLAPTAEIKTIPISEDRIPSRVDSRQECHAINNLIKPFKHRRNKSIMDFYPRTNNICICSSPLLHPPHSPPIHAFSCFETLALQLHIRPNSHFFPYFLIEFRLTGTLLEKLVMSEFIKCEKGEMEATVLR